MEFLSQQVLSNFLKLCHGHVVARQPVTSLHPDEMSVNIGVCLCFVSDMDGISLITVCSSSLLKSECQTSMLLSLQSHSTVTPELQHTIAVPVFLSVSHIL